MSTIKTPSKLLVSSPTTNNHRPIQIFFQSSSPGTTNYQLTLEAKNNLLKTKSTAIISLNQIREVGRNPSFNVLVLIMLLNYHSWFKGGSGDRGRS